PTRDASPSKKWRNSSIGAATRRRRRFSFFPPEASLATQAQRRLEATKANSDGALLGGVVECHTGRTQTSQYIRMGMAECVVQTTGNQRILSAYCLDKRCRR